MNRGNLKKFTYISVCILCIVFFFSLLVCSQGYEKSTPVYDGDLQTFAEVDEAFHEESQRITLPHSFNKLPPRTRITITSNITPKQGDCLYVKTVYAPLSVYVNDKLAYECGQPGSYPGFMKDPPTTVAVIPLDDVTGNAELRLEYLSPVSRDSLRVFPILVGKQAMILKALLETMGVSFVFSLVEIICGFMLVLIALIIVSFERKGISFLWLGFFSIAAGLWAFGECNLTGLFVKNAVMLYFLDFAGLFTFSIPMLLFCRSMINFQNEAFLKALYFINIAAACAAFMLQLFGAVDLSKSMYAFHILIPTTLTIASLYILRESMRYQNSAAKRIFLPMMILTVFCILELINYVVRFTDTLTMPFQIGTTIFVLLTGFIGGTFIKDAANINNEKQRLEFEVELMEHSVMQQKKHQQLLLDNEEAVRAQRHDLKHQLAVIRSLNMESENTALTDYLDELLKHIPEGSDRLFCENLVVNAIVGYYAEVAEKRGIELCIKISVPNHTEQITDSNLCVIFGNLLENAIEACDRMNEGHKFIKLKTRLQYGTLTITMDNSFDGIVNMRGERLISSKRDALGIGTSSILEIAHRHGGSAVFEQEGKVFKSSVYVRV